MKRFLATLVLSLSLIAPLSAFAFLGMNAGATLQGPLPAWTKQLGARTVPENTESRAVATDSSGNIYVAGFTSGDLNGNRRTGNYDFYLSKYNSAGTIAWTKQMGAAAASTYAMGIATDLSGNIFVAGYTTGGLDGNTLMGANDFFVTKFDSTGAKLWTRQLGVFSRYTTGMATATDASGNVYVTGSTTGSLDGNSQQGYSDTFITKYDSSGNKQWTKQFGVTAQGTDARAVTTDSSGNIYVAGSTTAGLDGNSLMGSQDFFVTKYDPSGTKLWTKQLGVASNTTTAYGVVADTSGNIFVTGYTSGGLDGNSGPSPSANIFITKYDSTGAKLWTKELGVAASSTYGAAVASDSSGNVYISGYTNGGLDGNSLTGTQDLIVTKYDPSGTKLWTKQLGMSSGTTFGVGITSFGGTVTIAGSVNAGLDGNTLTGVTDLFFTQYTSTGSKNWTKQMGALGPTTISSVVGTSDSSGNIYLAANTDGGVDGHSQTGLYDLIVAKYDSTGAKVWSRQIGDLTDFGKGTITPRGAATDPSGNVIVVGSTDGYFDGNNITGFNDFFVIKYNPSGTKLWSTQLGTVGGSNIAYGVATDSSGNILIAGYTDIGLDGNTLTGNNDLFVTKYSATGSKLWTTELGVTNQITSASAVTTDSSGNIYVAGLTDGDLDGNTVTGDQDLFVTKYDPTGAKLWTQQLGAASTYVYVKGAATDSNGNVVISGYTNGNLDGITHKGAWDSFVIKYDSSGAKQWTKLLAPTAPNYAMGYSVATDTVGNIFVAGEIGGALDGNKKFGQPDFFVTKYTSAGAIQWTKQLGVASNSTSASSVSIDTKGRLSVVGATSGGLDFNTVNGIYDAFACQYTGN